MHRTLCTLLLLAAFAGTAWGQRPRAFGAGVVVGDPAGLAWRYGLSERTAIAGVIGVSPYDRFRLNVDHLWYDRPFGEPRLRLHYGLGVALGFGRTGYFIERRGATYFIEERETGLGVRVPLGLDYAIGGTPLDAFFEIAPLFVVTPGMGSGIDAGLGLRVSF